MRNLRLVILAFVVALAQMACGGGGGSAGGAGNGSGPLPPFPGLSQYTIPPGATIDVSALNLLPFNGGDAVTYDRTQGGVINGTVTRTVVAPPGTVGIFNVTELDSTAPTAQVMTQYTVATITGIAGQTNYVLSDPLNASGTAPGLFNTVTTLAEYVTPFFPVGATRMYEAQGDLGADTDGDHLSDSFRFVYTQVFQGFEATTILGASRQLAHFTNTASLTVRGTAGGGDVTVASVEDTYFAPGIGLVKRVSGAVTQNGAVTQAPYSIAARSAFVGGVNYP
jgi:hypothetical protein